MELLEIAYTESFIFTFQYGSTLIVLLAKVRSLTCIYIPIWFYFNSTSPLCNRFWLLFTFQYGSTLMLAKLWNDTNRKLIYIPIWFYFNDQFRWYKRLFRKIYIPIWFYFNQVIYTRCRRFQTNLHSNMVLL